MEPIKITKKELQKFKKLIYEEETIKKLFMDIVQATSKYRSRIVEKEGRVWEKIGEKYGIDVKKYTYILDFKTGEIRLKDDKTKEDDK